MIAPPTLPYKIAKKAIFPRHYRGLEPSGADRLAMDEQTSTFVDDSRAFMVSFAR